MKMKSISFKKIISDEIISLYIYEEKIDFNTQMFQIVLNKTNSVIGFIEYDYTRDIENSNSQGNVFYRIYDNYQNKGYATKALHLLKNFIKNNKVENNKDLYFKVSYNNKYSKKVVLNNGGEILKEGSPMTDTTIGSPYILKIKI